MPAQTTPLPAPTQRDDVPIERRFDPDAFFSDEQARIKEWLALRANEELGSATLQQASTRIDTILMEIESQFAYRDTSINPALIGDTRNGTLQTYLPTRGTIIGFLAASIACSVLELGVIGLQVLFTDDMGWLALIPGVLLVLAAWFAGYGDGRVAVSQLARLFPTAWKVMPRASSIATGLVMGAAGNAAMCAVAVFRSDGLDGPEERFVVTVTIVLGLLIQAFHTAHTFFDEKYNYLWDRMASVQRWVANGRHRESNALYKQYYLDTVAHFSRGGGTANLPAARDNAN